MRLPRTQFKMHNSSPVTPLLSARGPTQGKDEASLSNRSGPLNVPKTAAATSTAITSPFHLQTNNDNSVQQNNHLETLFLACISALQVSEEQKPEQLSNPISPPHHRAETASAVQRTQPTGLHSQGGTLNVDEPRRPMSFRTDEKGLIEIRYGNGNPLFRHSFSTIQRWSPIPHMNISRRRNPHFANKRRNAAQNVSLAQKP
jgi:hypothetical protein